MKCPKCGTENNADYVFCVNCGTPISDAGDATQVYPTASFVRDAGSVPTAVFPPRETAPNTQVYSQSEPEAKKKRRLWPWLLAAGILGLIVIACGVGLFLLMSSSTITGGSRLPDHFGMFIVDPNGQNVGEIGKVESPNVLEAKDKLLADAARSRSNGAPDIILYAEGSDIPLSDLKFIDLGSINEQGELRQINFQAVPVEGKRAMKRIKFPNGVANGQYAFAVFEGPLDDGKHRLWPLQIENSTKADNNDIAKTLSVDISKKVPGDANTNTNANSNVSNATPDSTPEPTPAPKPTVTAPVGSTVAFCNSSNVIVRGAPGLNAKRLTMLKKGQRVFVIRYSDNTDMWKGVESNWAYIQTESGTRGWVFTPFISK